MAKFRLLFEVLNGLGLAESSQMHAPLPVPRRWLETVFISASITRRLREAPLIGKRSAGLVFRPPHLWCNALG